MMCSALTVAVVTKYSPRCTHRASALSGMPSCSKPKTCTSHLPSPRGLTLTACHGMGSER